MCIKSFHFSAARPPLAIIAILNLAGLSPSMDTSLLPCSEPLFVLSDGSNLRGYIHLLRHIGRTATASLPDFYGRNQLEFIEIDNWLLASKNLSPDSLLFESTLEKIDRQLCNSTYISGSSLSIADIAIWAGLAESGERWDSLRKSNKYPRIDRWLNLVMTEHGSVLNEVTTTYIGKKGLGETSAIKPKDKVKNVNGDVPENIKGRSKPLAEIDLPDAYDRKVRLRFAPEPNGYLHIGHSKEALLNKYFAERYQGQLILRFDDINPAKESNEFVGNLLKDIDTLGIKYEKITYTSDYFFYLKNMAEKLIWKDKAYVDDTPRLEMQKEIMDGIESKCRNQSVDENLKLWKEMIAGTERGLQCCVSGKMNMQDPNKSLRDPVYYRCNPLPHHRTGSEYKVYPTYDFACPLVDFLQSITHALRSSEYHDHNTQYYQIQEDAGVGKVLIYEFSGLDMVYTLLSKRRLLWFVQNGEVDGWDDPRFPTVQGIVSRGLKIEALMKFIVEHEASKKNLDPMEWDDLWYINRKIINPVYPRHFPVFADRRVLSTSPKIKSFSFSAATPPLPLVAAVKLARLSPWMINTSLPPDSDPILLLSDGAYMDVDCVEVSMTYLHDGRFNVVRILHGEEDTGSHASDLIDSDYWAFLENYVSGGEVSDNEETEVSLGVSFGEDDN